MKQEAAIDLPNGVEFKATATVRMDVLVALPCGQLCRRNVDFWVIEQRMADVLLGRPPLRCIGLDLERTLTDLCTSSGGEVGIQARMKEEMNHPC